MCVQGEGAEYQAVYANLLVTFKLSGSGVAPSGGLLVAEAGVLPPRCRCNEVGDVSVALVPPVASPRGATGAELGSTGVADDDSPVWPEAGAPLIVSVVLRSLVELRRSAEFDEMLVSPQVLLALLDSLLSTPRSSGIVGELAPAK
uniref:Uncharacterized protein n=1 Tax=Ascaris lumbricoides TaxID=6252 RepID=A0A0M3HRN7_ASCLU